ncbi:MAG TPA: hypothetical protein VEX18_21250 [Polyangiaceae bacterium]|nr:hypothetical protein [Polyangiaceae bacterium]
MREPGIPKLLTWRWAPCLALALGAFSFCAFALLAIPDQIGGLETGSPSMRLGNQLSRTQAAPGAGNWSDSEASGEGEEGKPSAASPANHLASRAAGSFPKRGFTPPLDRPEPSPGAAPSPVPAPPPTAIPAPSPEGEAAPAPPPAPTPAQTDPAAPAPVAPTAN